jgi:transposase
VTATAPPVASRTASTPSGRSGEAEREARRQVVVALVSAIRPLLEHIRLLTSEIGALLADHPDGATFRSLFRDPKSVVTAAELLSEIGDRRDRHPHSSSLEAIAGHAPIAVESGKKKVACFRWACNKTLRSAVSVLADSSRKHNPWANDIYQRARARGHDHPHALRIHGRAWLRIIWRIWQDSTTHDPTRHGNLNRLLAAKG